MEIIEHVIFTIGPPNADLISLCRPLNGKEKSINLSDLCASAVDIHNSQIRFYSPS